MREQFRAVTSKVPEWFDIMGALPLVPNRATEKVYYRTMKRFQLQQKTYLEMLSDNNTLLDEEVAQQWLQKETRKLNVLMSRLEIYDSILEYQQRIGEPEGEGEGHGSRVSGVFFNEMLLAADHTSGNDKNIMRAIFTFRQAKMLLKSMSLKLLIQKGFVIADLNEIGLSLIHI